MLLIAQFIYRHSGSGPWEPIIEVASKDEAISYIESHPEKWQERGDGRGTHLAVVPDGGYTWLPSDKWAWHPAEADEIDSNYSPY